jgi:hypothetical protein
MPKSNEANSRAISPNQNTMRYDLRNSDIG